MEVEAILPVELFVGLDRSSPVPLYHQVAGRIERTIRQDVLRPGMRIENEIGMGRRLGLSRPTVRKAIEQLVDKGLLVRLRGVGTQVVEAPVKRDAGISSLYEDLIASGQRPSTTLIDQSVIETDESTSLALNLDPGSPARRLIRVRFANGLPLAILTNVLPLDIGPFTDHELANHGLYQLLRARGITVRVTDQLVGARAATDDEHRTLQLPDDSPVLTMLRTAYDGMGRAVEHGHHSYAPDRYALRYTLVEK